MSIYLFRSLLGPRWQYIMNDIFIFIKMNDIFIFCFHVDVFNLQNVSLVFFETTSYD